MSVVITVGSVGHTGSLAAVTSETKASKHGLAYLEVSPVVGVLVRTGAVLQLWHA